MPAEMEGKVALVTGSGSGIGRATTLAFAQRGARVVVADIDAAGGEETLRMIEAGGGQGIFVKTDVTRAAEVEALVSRAVQTYGQLDYAHNNAGIEGMSVNILEYEEEVWDRTIGVNLKGVWLCLKSEVAQMLKQGKGAIVNTSSMAGLEAIPGASAYIASKHGVIGLTKAAAAEYGDAGIRVNAICPGPIDTPMIDRLRKATNDKYAVQPKAPAEVAEAVLWLCSDAASLVNGNAMILAGDTGP